jgi:hypothetical protein
MNVTAVFLRVLKYSPQWSHLDGATDAYDQDDAASVLIDEPVDVLVAQHHHVDVVWKGAVVAREVGLPSPYARQL